MFNARASAARPLPNAILLRGDLVVHAFLGMPHKNMFNNQ
jgi:hypothetical protein